MGYFDNPALPAILGAGAVGGALPGVIPASMYGGPSGFLDALAGSDPTKKLKNNFQAQAPTIDFQAQAPVIQQTDFGSPLAGALAQNPAANPFLADAQSRGLRAPGQQLLGQAANAYGQEQGLIGQLQAEAGGYGPGQSLAQALLNQATQANIKQGAGLLASQKGINPALAQREIAQNTAMANQNAAAQGAQLDFQQQLAARQQLGGILGSEQGLYGGLGANLLATGRGQDISAGLGVGGLQNQRLGALIGGQQGQNALISQGSLGAQGINADIAKAGAGYGVQTQGINAGVSIGNQDTTNKLVGGLINAGGGVAAAGMGAAHGAKIPGKAKVAGDSPENDTVPIMASPGEVVLPRSVADDPEKAAEFVAHLKGSSKKDKLGPKGYGKILAKHREIKSMMNELEALMKRSA